VLPQAPDPDALESLKRTATARAEALGHHLQVFRAAKHDPLCYVSFCTACRQMVLLNVAPRPTDRHPSQPAGEHRQCLFGYALEAPCGVKTTADGVAVREHAEAH
jgi:hypothetical protein